MGTIRSALSDLVQGSVFGHPSQPALERDQLGFFANSLNVEFITLLLQLSDLLAIFIFIHETLRELVLGFVSGSKRLQQQERSKDVDAWQSEKNLRVCVCAWVCVCVLTWSLSFSTSFSCVAMVLMRLRYISQSFCSVEHFNSRSSFSSKYYTNTHTHTRQQQWCYLSLLSKDWQTEEGKLRAEGRHTTLLLQGA